MRPVQRDRIASAVASVLMHTLLAFLLWLGLTEWDHESVKDPVQFVELVQMPKLEEPEPTTPAALSTANHHSDQEKPRQIHPVEPQETPSSPSKERSRKIPDPVIPPKSVAKPANSKAAAKPISDKKAMLKKGEKEDVEEIKEDNPPAQIAIPLSLTPSLEAVARWDRERRVRSQNRATHTGEEIVDINTKSAQFGDYFARVKQRITWSWIYPQQAKNEGLSGNVDLIFTINREGKVVEVKVTRSSGVPVLDQEAVAAVRKAAPFEPLPEDWQPAKMIIRSTFEYVLSNAGMRIVR
ncbi:MAG: energy transducer TonB [Magnetococcales bacterium]|nr:energy transducer TonB [Magnetococcales bacterium]MBF0114823.1 energy transducer TonB [Magnetococcales bacterium]